MTNEEKYKEHISTAVEPPQVSDFFIVNLVSKPWSYLEIYLSSSSKRN